MRRKKRPWYEETPFLRLLQANFSPVDESVRQNAARLFETADAASIFDGQAAFRAGDSFRFMEEAFGGGIEEATVLEKTMQMPGIGGIASGVLQAFADKLTGVFSASRGKEALAYTEQALTEVATGNADKGVAVSIKSKEAADRAAATLPRWEQWNKHGGMPIPGLKQRIIQKGDTDAMQPLSAGMAFAPADFTAKGLFSERLPALSVFSKGQQMIAWENTKKEINPMQNLDLVIRREAALRPPIVRSNLHEKPRDFWLNHLGGQEQTWSAGAVNSVSYRPVMAYAAHAENRYRDMEPQEIPTALHTWGESGAEADYLPAMELRHMQESVGQEVKVRLVAPEIKVDMSGMQNSISSEMDIDRFLGTLTDKLERALSISAAGVHMG